MIKLKTEAEMRAERAKHTKESSIEDHYIATAKKYGCLQRKITQFYAPDGWPDRICIWPDGKGTTDWAELKRPVGGRYSKRQLEVIAALRERGAYVAQIESRADVDWYFEHRAAELGVKRLKPGSKRGLARLKQLQELDE